MTKATSPKKASEGGLKAPTKASRKTKTMKAEQEAAAVAGAAEPEDNGDGDEGMEEDNEDGKSLSHKVSAKATKSIKFTTHAEVASSNSLLATPGGPNEVFTSDIIDAASVEFEVSVAMDDRPAVDNVAMATNEAAITMNDAAYVMDDEHEARIREMPLEAWLKWKAESGYTFDLMSL
jgi:hypothetical protein